MSSFHDLIKCPQCGYEQADYQYTCGTAEDFTTCGCCGYHERWDAKYDEEGNFCGWKHEISRGTGALGYRLVGDITYCVHAFNTNPDALDAERWLRDGITKGEINPASCYLTRWNREAKQVEFVVGKSCGLPETDGDKSEGKVAPPESSSQPVQPDASNATVVSPDETDFLDEV